MSIKKKILSITIIPVLLLGIVSIFLTFTTVKGALINQIEEALKGTAAATLAAYDQNTGDYLQTSNGDIWKGSYNISKSESLVDRIKKNTDMDVTFFYGNERIMTSAADSDGNRILGSPAGDVIITKVLQNCLQERTKSVRCQRLRLRSEMPCSLLSVKFQKMQSICQRHRMCWGWQQTPPTAR